MYRTTQKYLGKLKYLLRVQLENITYKYLNCRNCSNLHIHSNFLLIRTNAKTGVEKSRMDLYQSITVLFVVFLLTPIIIYTNSKMAISSEVRNFLFAGLFNIFFYLTCKNNFFLRHS